MAEISDQLFDCLCRACMHEVDESSALQANTNTNPEQKWQSIFDSIEECGALRIYELLSKTIPQMEEVQQRDELPKKICCDCLQQLVSAHRFQQICLQSDQQMRELLAKKIADKKTAINEPSLVEVGKLANDSRGLRIEFACVDTMTVVAQLNVADPLTSTCDANEHSMDTDFDMSGYVKTEIVNDESSDDEPLLPMVAVKDEVMKGETEVAQTSLSSSEQKCDPGDLKADLEQDKKEDKKSQVPLQPKKKTEKSFKCDICERCFQKPEALHKHRLKHDVNKVDNKKTKHACDQCERTYNSPVTLANHKRVRHSIEQPQKTRFPCDFCDKTYKSAVALKNHARRHTGDRVLCPECGKSFTTEGNLKQHRLRHRGEKPYECPYCPLRFPCISGVYNHKKIHEEKRNICDICGAAFSQAYELKKHKKYHIGERKYKCDYCEMRFVRPDHQRRHMRTHTGEKPYKCKYCDRAYAQSNDHIKHLRTHLGDNVYRCELCPLAFRLASEMRLHFVSHKNDDEETRARHMKALKEVESRMSSVLGGGVAVASGDNFHSVDSNV